VIPQFNLSAFISKITGREQSMFLPDIHKNHQLLWKEIHQKSVLVIGGAGTIGSSFIRALLPFEPERVVIIDTDENRLTELVRDVRSSQNLFVPKTFITYPLNFSNPIFNKLFQQQGPFDIVANFAAHKHVRSEKDIISIEAMIENNVLSAQYLLEILRAMPPQHFFCVSTDKAANPVNVMGASKKMMEDLILAYSRYFPITTARFANVAFSNGSLLHGFLERLMKQQPLSVPSDVKRFFVSPEESGQLCMLACILGESGDIFFPKLNPEQDMIGFKPITIKFLKELGYEADVCHSEEEAKEKASNMATGQPTKSYPVHFFESDTNGEKSFEEFYTDHETVIMDRFNQLGIIKNTSSKQLSEINNMISDMRNLFKNPNLNKAMLVEQIAQYVTGFEHIERGKNLDQRM
jgi:FlaA1/EpsC-like NDP-sugar epimerase